MKPKKYNKNGGKKDKGGAKMDKDSDEIKGIPESYQEYLETIYRLYLHNISMDKNINEISNNNIAKNLKIKPSSVTNMLKKLAEHKLIVWRPRSRKIRLTLRGKKVGRRVIYNHVLMELMLRMIFHIKDSEKRHDIACGLEHHLDEYLFNAVKRTFGEEITDKIEELLENDKDPDEIIDSITEKEFYLINIEDFINTYNRYLLEGAPEGSSLKEYIESKSKSFIAKYKESFALSNSLK
ncbi:MAG: metal-dependent transcriptional regulator [Promethearchaeota archaeon]